MNRRGFLARFGLGAGAAAVASRLPLSAPAAPATPDLGVGTCRRCQEEPTLKGSRLCQKCLNALLIVANNDVELTLAEFVGAAPASKARRMVSDHFVNAQQPGRRRRR